MFTIIMQNEYYYYYYYISENGKKKYTNTDVCVCVCICDYRKTSLQKSMGLQDVQKNRSFALSLQFFFFNIQYNF